MKKSGIKNPTGARVPTKGEAFKAGRKKAMAAGKKRRVMQKKRDKLRWPD